MVWYDLTAQQYTLRKDRQPHNTKCGHETSACEFEIKKTEIEPSHVLETRMHEGADEGRCAWVVIPTAADKCRHGHGVAASITERKLVLAGHYSRMACPSSLLCDGLGCHWHAGLICLKPCLLRLQILDHVWHVNLRRQQREGGEWSKREIGV